MRQDERADNLWRRLEGGRYDGSGSEEEVNEADEEKADEAALEQELCMPHRLSQ